MRRAKFGLVMVFASACLVLLAGHGVLAMSKGVGATGSGCKCSTGDGTCSGAAGRLCYKADNDTCSGTCSDARTLGAGAAKHKSSGAGMQAH